MAKRRLFFILRQLKTICREDMLSWANRLSRRCIEKLKKSRIARWLNGGQLVIKWRGVKNIVAEEFQKGYTYRDSVVRHSMVKVAN